MRSACVGALAAAAAGASAEPSVYPTGATIYDPARAYNSYVLFAGGDDVTRLVDLTGKVVREWKYTGQPVSFIDPALVEGARGHIFVTLESEEGRGTDLTPGRAQTRVRKTVGEVDWDGKPVWSFGSAAPGGVARQHHDITRLPNGNTLLLANISYPLPGFAAPQVLDDVAYEANPDGDIVWTWAASDHLEEIGFTADELRLIKGSKNPDYLHVNDLKPVGPNHWHDEGDARFAPDNLIFDSRNGNFIAIVDRKTRKIVWTLGPHFPPVSEDGTTTSRKVPRPVDQISGQHDAQIIPKGLPGAGNLLVFDNQGEAGYPRASVTYTGGSRVLEIDPVTKQIVWQYTGASSGNPGWTFRSTHISNARRLPNGNTFIDEGQIGRFFQVTPEGEIVWEYLNPYPRRGKDAETGRPTLNYSIYRAQPVPYDWAPEGTPHAETAIAPPENAGFRVTSK
ncbi:ArsR family transcriptional regulator [Methylosinus sp. R-45379]|uniref:aryl-sulfate sulfotransferase n=1 Tax=Methylosinus sp. R-45379 TaxID=980563 RepID=UPI0007C881B0|nr:aryl-sulfate sulfotransferase [Methylosinus sp. R-45379]OAI23747.1 ArsR family transcriptional regulator [Methylosinus sp. R-45379]